MPDSSGTAVTRRGSGASLALSGPALLRLPLKYPRLALVLVLWLLGLYLAFLARPPPITAEQTAAFRVKIKQAEGLVGELSAAERALVEAQVEQGQYKVWFWRFKPEARERVAAHQPAVDEAQERLREIQGRQDQLLREAKAALGLWSEAGVDEGRDLFWASFASGKMFAQRQSFGDAFFILLNSRERDWLSMLLNLLFRTLLNFFSGMVVAIFVFLFKLPSLILSYQPALWSGLAFFSLAAVAGMSVIASYLGLLFGAGATATYATLTMVAAQQQRVEGGPPQRRIDYRQRAHHE